MLNLLIQREKQLLTVMKNEKSQFFSYSKKVAVNRHYSRFIAESHRLMTPRIIYSAESLLVDTVNQNFRFQSRMSPGIQKQIRKPSFSMRILKGAQKK